jgi:AAA15 family ATPase/GTPase
MLLQFVVENFRSFHQDVLLNLVPAKSKIHPGHVIESGEKGNKKVKVLPLAVLYGANASGKSNLVRAMQFAKDLIVKGTRAEQQIDSMPFRLSPEAADKPSRFEFVLKHKDVLYTYGFAVTKEEVKEEWLFAVFQKQEVRLFERVTDVGKARVEVGDRLAPTKDEEQRLQFVAAGTRPNQLFLTEANERNVDGVKPLMQWFRDCLTIIRPGSYSRLVHRAGGDKRFAQFLSAFLGIADTGVQSVDVRAEEFDFERGRIPGIPDSVKKSVLDKLARYPEVSVFAADGRNFAALRREGGKAPQLLRLQTIHKSADGSDVYFDTKDESDGTQRMMHLAPALFDLGSAQNVYVIDEVDRSMHPLMCRLYVEAFLRGVMEQKSLCQMILTTHQTCLLDLDLLRRDEIWFVEKDEIGSSHLTSLAEYEVRNDLKIDKGYLNGRFGAIPFIGDIRQLFPTGANE